MASAAFAATATFGACATGATVGTGEAPGVVERFANTTHACPRPMAVRVSWVGADAAPVRVAPGEEITLIAPAGGAGGGELVVVADDDAGREVARLLRLAGEGPRRARYVGCAAPEHLSAGPGTGALRVAHGAHGCAPGLRGAVDVRLGGRAVAEVPPGEEATAFVPLGALTFDVSLDGGDDRRERAERCSGGRVEATVDADGGAIAIGWSPRGPRAGGLAPLSVLGPAASCPDAARREVRAAGIDVALGPGEAYTLFLPQGRHRVTVVDVMGGTDPTIPTDGDGVRVARDLALEVGAEGVVVPARACDATAAPREERS